MNGLEWKSEFVLFYITIDNPPVESVNCSVTFIWLYRKMSLFAASWQNHLLYIPFQHDEVKLYDDSPAIHCYVSGIFNLSLRHS